MVSIVAPGSMCVFGSIVLGSLFVKFVKLLPLVGLDSVMVTSSGLVVGAVCLPEVVLVVGGAGVVGGGVEGDCVVGGGVVGGFVGRVVVGGGCVVGDGMVGGGEVVGGGSVGIGAEE